MNFADPTGTVTLPFVGQVDAGEGKGALATDAYADVIADPNAGWLLKAGAWIGGSFSSLWTPCTSDKTLATLLAAEGANQYLYRPMWQYYPELNPKYASKFATRGWGRLPPYTVPADAAARLALPEYNPATAVRQVEMKPWEYYKGPEIIRPANGQPGGGIQYVRREKPW